MVGCNKRFARKTVLTTHYKLAHDTTGTKQRTTVLQWRPLNEQQQQQHHEKWTATDSFYLPDLSSPTSPESISTCYDLPLSPPSYHYFHPEHHLPHQHLQLQHQHLQQQKHHHHERKDSGCSLPRLQELDPFFAPMPYTLWFYFPPMPYASLWLRLCRVIPLIALWLHYFLMLLYDIY